MIEPKHLVDNPFFVLELAGDCSSMDIERAGQKLLAMLKVGMASAKTYKTPLGDKTRDEDAVRRAMADLRDPDKRSGFAYWAQPDVWRARDIPAATAETPVWREAHKRLGTLDAAVEAAPPTIETV